ncbi:MAG: hypothetical protein M1327_00180 [Candidatus Thermoplasmatota archaeon]|nr:hypothetical protein [Candidatus Thermoplasmatota archaeon]
MEILSPLNIYGISVLLAMLFFYIREVRSRAYTLLFSLSCIASSIYGFLAGTWPFGVVEFVWFVFSFRKYIGLRKTKHYA